jgi:hypothetical protein
MTAEDPIQVEPQKPLPTVEWTDRPFVEAQPAPDAWAADATGRAYVYLTVVVFLAGLSIGLAL